jgi:hypothetical protein
MLGAISTLSDAGIVTFIRFLLILQNVEMVWLESSLRDTYPPICLSNLDQTETLKLKSYYPLKNVKE